MQSQFLTILLMRIIKDDLKNKADIQLSPSNDGIYTMQYPKKLSVLLYIATFISLVLYIIVQSKGILEGSILFGGWTLLLILTILIVKFDIIEFDSKGVNSKYIFQKKKHLDWNSINKASFTPNINELTLTGTQDGKQVKIVVRMMLIGFSDFLNKLKQNAPSLDTTGLSEKVSKSFAEL